MVTHRLYKMAANASCSLTPVWSLLSAGTELVAVSGRQPEERIHSAGRVLADRSVLFKVRTVLRHENAKGLFLVCILNGSEARRREIRLLVKIRQLKSSSHHRA
jgi:hypothetical protein